MSSLSQQVMQGVEGLPEAEQRQVLDFIEFLKVKHQQTETRSAGVEPKSFAEVARASIGSAKGPGDLATNPVYMEGYGQ